MRTLMAGGVGSQHNLRGDLNAMNEGVTFLWLR
jgi:hypothetical protein